MGKVEISTKELVRLRTIEAAAVAVAEDWAPQPAADFLDVDLLDALAEAVNVPLYSSYSHPVELCRTEVPTGSGVQQGERTGCCACGRAWEWQQPSLRERLAGARGWWNSVGTTP